MVVAISPNERRYPSAAALSNKHTSTVEKVFDLTSREFVTSYMTDKRMHDPGRLCRLIML